MIFWQLCSDRVKIPFISSRMPLKNLPSLRTQAVCDFCSPSLTRMVFLGVTAAGQGKRN